VCTNTSWMVLCQPSDVWRVARFVSRIGEWRLLTSVEWAFPCRFSQCCRIKTILQKSVQCESKNLPLIFFLTFSPNGWKVLVQILHAYSTFLSTLEYKFLFNYLHRWRSYAILSATTIICWKRPPSVEKHAGWSWSHLMWHNFVTVRDNWIKICNLA